MNFNLVQIIGIINLKPKTMNLYKLVFTIAEGKLIAEPEEIVMVKKCEFFFTCFRTIGNEVILHMKLSELKKITEHYGIIAINRHLIINLLHLELITNCPKPSLKMKYIAEKISISEKNARRLCKMIKKMTSNTSENE